MKRIIAFIVILVLMMSMLGSSAFADSVLTLDAGGGFMDWWDFQDAIKTLPDNSTVVLNNGTYRIILNPEDYPYNTPVNYPKNLTIKAGSNAYVSNFQSSVNVNVIGYVLSGLSIGSVELNGLVDGFTVDACVVGNFTANVGGNFNNITIKNSTLTASSGNAIALNDSSTNVNITNNNITTAPEIGIILNDDIYGNVNISGNNISGTGNRAIRLVNVYGTVNISNNSINNCAVAEVTDRGLFKVDLTGASGAVNFSGNTYAAKTWQPANVGANSGSATYLLSDNTVCTVSFNSNGGSAVSPVVVTKGGTIAALPSAIKDGYTLLGWFTAAEGGEAITAATVFNADTTVYAHWATVNDNPYGVPSTGSERDTALMIVLAAISGSVLLFSLRRKREA